MKLKAPFYKYYNCKIINKYKEEIFNKDDEYIIISYGVLLKLQTPPEIESLHMISGEDENDSSICFDVKHILPPTSFIT